MKIGIDARFYGPSSKGLGRYTQKLIEHLENIDHTNKYVIFLRRDSFDSYEPRNKNFSKVVADYPWYSFAEQIFFPLLLRKQKCDFIHFPHFNVPLLYTGRFAVTIHDLILIHFPTVRASTLNPLFYWLKFLCYKIVIYAAIMRSERIFSVSAFTKKDILSHYNVPKEKIVVTHQAGFSASDKPKNENVLADYGILKPYAMYVGNAYPHKNLERLVLAYKAAQKKLKDTQLVLVGGDDYFYRRLEKFITDKGISQIRVLHALSDDELAALYRNAHAYVFPSLYEGFGLPPLEAMTYGVPVTSSDHPCMQEILGESALYFDGKDRQAIADAIVTIMTDETLRAALSQKGKNQQRKYSWTRMAEHTQEIYRTIGQS